PYRRYSAPILFLKTIMVSAHTASRIFANHEFSTASTQCARIVSLLSSTAHLQAKSAAIDEKKGAAMLECELETPKLKERPTPPGVIRCPICSQESHVGNDVRYVHAMLLDY
uniref:Uncharacterized protein n=1 Tax=Caenorhabditis japonica TaxID=281687 RepID=A0A8R1EH58_CAEJA